MSASYIELTKPRIVLLVMLTAGLGFWLAGPPVDRPFLLFHLLLGTMLVAAGTNALNQVSERDVDAVMNRTRNRPLPSGRMSVGAATAFAWGTGAGGVLYLAMLVNALSAVLAALTLLSYVYIYTPLKRTTTLATLIGAVPGALPIVGGWAAARGTLGIEAAGLFAIMFLWQLPHFLALAWLYRDDYKRAGLRMLSVDDPDGRLTFAFAAVYAAALVPASLLPSAQGIAGTRYFAGALILSALFLALTLAAALRPTPVRARRLFHASLAYLPALLIMLGTDHNS